jgi:hypothetical protein
MTTAAELATYRDWPSSLALREQRWLMRVGSSLAPPTLFEGAAPRGADARSESPSPQCLPAPRCNIEPNVTDGEGRQARPPTAHPPRAFQCRPIIRSSFAIARGGRPVVHVHKHSQPTEPARDKDRGCTISTEFGILAFERGGSEILPGPRHSHILRSLVRLRES